MAGPQGPAGRKGGPGSCQRLLRGLQGGGTAVGPAEIGCNMLALPLGCRATAAAATGSSAVRCRDWRPVVVQEGREAPHKGHHTHQADTAGHELLSLRWPPCRKVPLPTRRASGPLDLAVGFRSRHWCIQEPPVMPLRFLGSLPSWQAPRRGAGTSLLGTCAG